jgi:hypothetical protein
LIGTRALLGEGWDAQRVNVLVDLTAATTSAAALQLRGRSLRLDPALPRKVADNWDVVCVAPAYPRGLADYERLVRKHDRYYALSPEGFIESGVSHIASTFSPYAPPPVEQFGEINESILHLTSRRDQAYEAWRVGEPYRNAEQQTIRIRPEQPAEPAAVRMDPRQPLESIRPGVDVRSALTGVFALGSLLAGAVAGAEGPGIVAAILLGGGGGAWSLDAMRRSVARTGPSNALDDPARAVAEALALTGGIGHGLNAEAVRVEIEADGFYRCRLHEASIEESRLFAVALGEVLAPLRDLRYLIPRYIPQQSGGFVDTVRRYIRQQARGRVGDAVVYHAVPSYLAVNKERAMAFARSWNRYVSAGAPIYRSDPRAAAILKVQGASDPFAVTSQMRTLWS